MELQPFVCLAWDDTFSSCTKEARQVSGNFFFVILKVARVLLSITKFSVGVQSERVSER